jgi:dienelactone hydrolase
MKTIGITGAVVLLVSLASFQLFAQGYKTMDTVYTPAGYPEGPLQATIYIPSTPNGIGVILAHWRTGTRQTPHAWCEAFAANGYVAMTIDYYDFESSVNSRFPKPIRAYKTAIEFLRRNAERFGIRTGKIVGFGQSEGSIHWGEAITENHDDAFLGIDSLVADSVDAAVLLYGAYDNEHFLQSTLGYDQSLAIYFADYPDFRATKGNCIANFLNIRCPVLLFHGPYDNNLQFQQSLELRDSMAAHHMKVELLSNSSWDHGFDSDNSGNFSSDGLVAKDSVLAFLRRELQSLTSSVAQEIRVPLQFSLRQNFPNPFNPSTTIRYGLPHQSNVSLDVYNTLGQKVTELVNESQDAGYHEVRFDATGLASGVYFYRLQAGGFVNVKRLVVTK